MNPHRPLTDEERRQSEYSHLQMDTPPKIYQRTWFGWLVGIALLVAGLVMNFLVSRGSR
jgi:hypothetical protein